MIAQYERSIALYKNTIDDWPPGIPWWDDWGVRQLGLEIQKMRDQLPDAYTSIGPY